MEEFPWSPWSEPQRRSEPAPGFAERVMAALPHRPPARRRTARAPSRPWLLPVALSALVLTLHALLAAAAVLATPLLAQ
jgi:hypothetical protein